MVGQQLKMRIGKLPFIGKRKMENGGTSL